MSRHYEINGTLQSGQEKFAFAECWSKLLLVRNIKNIPKFSIMIIMCPDYCI